MTVEAHGSLILALGLPVAVVGVFLFFGTGSSGALGVFVMLVGAACFIVWMILSARAGSRAAGRRSIGSGVMIGLIGLLFLFSFRGGTNGASIGLIATSCGALFFFGGLAILLMQP